MELLQSLTLSLGFDSYLNIFLHFIFVLLFGLWMFWYGRLERRRIREILLNYGSCKNMNKLLHMRSRALSSTYGDGNQVV